MSTATIDLHEVPAESGEVNYLNAKYGICLWLLTLDHKSVWLI